MMDRQGNLPVLSFFICRSQDYMTYQSLNAPTAHLAAL